MAEKSLPDFLSQLFSGDSETTPAAGGKNNDPQTNMLAESLKAIAGQAGGPLQSAVGEFLNGKGALAETTRAAATSGGSGLGDIISQLVTQFKLPPAIANLVAPLLARLLPSVVKPAEAEPAAKPKARRKAKPKTETSKSEKKPKKKTPARSKTSTVKAAAKKKPAAKAHKREAN